MIHVMIAEDERLGREELIYLLEQEEDVVICPSAENGEQLLELYEEYSPDVLFLDIHMPCLTGLEVASILRKETGERPVIVFTTAYDSYAVQAFDLKVTDYLLKPFDKERFTRTMERVREDLLKKNNKRPKIDKLVISLDKKIVVIDPNQIGYAVREGRQVNLHMLNNEMIETKMNLKELEEKLLNFSFYRPHRSYLVNLNAIEEITPWFNGAYNIVIGDKEKTKVPMSRNTARDFFDLLQGLS
ncbi:two component transcriptional regulator, LytTR family [Gracilibacillus ureilyticus]|uniref:Two component transcriptional regulator, LytTR family n=1 Tax=Gracilibacillus ureilyticus TaxID=531814 RepID=A0A1H9QKK1_9BACI|nr:LytTR family DNA-binding domain-containing protein [Gracilibacillus ureilyticus]SER60937.1 two component transcriptional regulator, LytTR family [Gracilibacillus ureilyticus]